MATVLSNGTGELLILDKDKHIRDLLSIIFQHEGYAPTNAWEGKKALEQVLLQRFSLILADTHLPDLDSRAFLAEVKKICRQAKVTMMSIDSYNHRHFELIGALGFVEKPLSRMDLMATLEKIRNERRTTRRFDCRFPVVVDDRIQATSINLSSDGILLESNTPLSDKNELTVTMHNTENGNQIQVRGKVIRSDTVNLQYVTALYFNENIGHQILKNVDFFDKLL